MRMKARSRAGDWWRCWIFPALVCAFFALPSPAAAQLGGKPENQIDVERFSEARVRNRRRETQRRKLLCGLDALRKPRTVGKQRDLAAFADDAARCGGPGGGVAGCQSGPGGGAV